MSASDWREQLPAKVRILQIIVAAMSFGCFCLLIISVLVAQNFNKAVAQPMLTYIALVLAAMSLGICAVIPRIIVSQGRREIARKLLPASKIESDNSINNMAERENIKIFEIFGLLQIKTIVVCSMLEGPVIFLLIVYMVDHQILSLLAALVLLILLIIQTPTIGRVTIWLEDQMKLVDEERVFG